MKPVVARLVVFGAAVGSLALLAGAVMLVLRLAQPPEYPVDLSRTPDGEIVGRVAKIEPGAILVNAEPPGSGVVPIVVTKDTRVMVGTVDGWMADVRPGGQIKVTYDQYQGRKLARSVEVLPEQGARRLAPVEAPASQKPVDLPPAAAPPVAAVPPPPPAAPPTLKPVAPTTATPAPVQPPEAPAPRPKAEPPRVALPKTMTPTPATPAPPTPAPEAPASRPKPAPPRVAQPKATTPPPAAATPPTPVAPASAPLRPAPPAPEPPVRAQEPARPQEPDNTDGSAAVDWFLKGRR